MCKSRPETYFTGSSTTIKSGTSSLKGIDNNRIYNSYNLENFLKSVATYLQTK